MITKDMAIGEVVEKYPETVEVFMSHGLRCMGCMMAMMETIEQGARSHGIDPKKLLKELNSVIEARE